jgi:hypothetical protein
MPDLSSDESTTTMKTGSAAADTFGIVNSVPAKTAKKIPKSHRYDFPG